MQQAPINRITEFLLSAPAREEIRPVLDLHMAYRIGRRLKTAKYLE
jgi:hypothetical protein